MPENERKPTTDPTKTRRSTDQRQISMSVWVGTDHCPTKTRQCRFGRVSMLTLVSVACFSFSILAKVSSESKSNNMSLEMWAIYKITWLSGERSRSESRGRGFESFFLHFFYPWFARGPLSFIVKNVMISHHQILKTPPKIFLFSSAIALVKSEREVRTFLAGTTAPGGGQRFSPYMEKIFFSRAMLYFHR